MQIVNLYPWIDGIQHKKSALFNISPCHISPLKRRQNNPLPIKQMIFTQLQMDAGNDSIRFLWLKSVSAKQFMEHLATDRIWRPSSDVYRLLTDGIGISPSLQLGGLCCFLQLHYVKCIIIERVAAGGTLSLSQANKQVQIG